MREPTHFLFLIHPPRPTFVNDMTQDEGAIMGAHFAYLQGLSAQGKLLLAGPCLDEGGFGVGILSVTDADEARRIVDADPSVTRGLMRPELHPVRLSFLK